MSHPLLAAQGTVVAPNAASGETLHRGSQQQQQSPSVVSVQLTPFAMVQSDGSSTTTLLTYQPAVTSTKIGASLPYSQFNYLDPNGFEVNFNFDRNTFTIQRYGHHVQFSILSIRNQI